MEGKEIVWDTGVTGAAGCRKEWTSNLRRRVPAIGGNILTSSFPFFIVQLAAALTRDRSRTCCSRAESRD
eukprot:746463-Hanusia_phi.AAC.1